MPPFFPNGEEVHTYLHGGVQGGHGVLQVPVCVGRQFLGLFGLFPRRHFLFPERFRRPVQIDSFLAQPLVQLFNFRFQPGNFWILFRDFIRQLVDEGVGIVDLDVGRKRISW